MGSIFSSVLEDSLTDFVSGIQELVVFWCGGVYVVYSSTVIWLNVIVLLAWFVVTVKSNGSNMAIRFDPGRLWKVNVKVT